MRDKFIGLARQETGQIEGLSYKSRTLREQLNDQKLGMELRIKEIDEAILLLDRNPDFERLQELLSR